MHRSRLTNTPAPPASQTPAPEQQPQLSVAEEPEKECSEYAKSRLYNMSNSIMLSINSEQQREMFIEVGTNLSHEKTMSSNIKINLLRNKPKYTANLDENNYRVYTPGEPITEQKDFMRGHGTYVEDGEIKSSVVGVVKQINKLISVIPIKSKYVGEIGDVVVGRVTEIQKKRWKIDTSSRLDSVLLISSINLPGGELRRRNAEDEQSMRKLLQEEDLLSAEVQNVFIDGSLSLHTRSLKYGKLSQGILVTVAPSLIKRRKTHFHNLPCGVSLIIGNNGYIWVSLTVNIEVEGQGGFTQNLEAISKSDREGIVRIKNCILALSSCYVMIYDTSIMLAYEESLKYEVKELLNQDIMHEIGFNSKQRLLMQHE